MTVRVIYQGGTFRPDGECELEEGTPGVVFVERAPEADVVSNPEERRRLLAELVERMQSHPLPLDSPRLTREQMHDRA